MTLKTTLYSFLKKFLFNLVKKSYVKDKEAVWLTDVELIQIFFAYFLNLRLYVSCEPLDHTIIAITICIQNQGLCQPRWSYI